MEAVKTVRLDTVQLHGEEPPEIAEDLMEAGIRVWKAVRVENLESIKPFGDYPCDALVLDAFDPKSPEEPGRLLIGASSLSGIHRNRGYSRAA